MEAADNKSRDSVAVQVALWAVPAAAALIILLLVSMGFGWIPMAGYPLETWVLMGTGVLTVLFVVGVALLLRTGGRKARSPEGDGAPEDAEAAPAEPAEAVASEVAAPALDTADAHAEDLVDPSPREDPAVAAREPDDAVVLLDDALAGRRVAEYQRPAKDRAGDAVYASTVVAVAEDLVLRVEDRVASRRANL